MMITPDSKIVLLQNDLALDNKNQITFANKDDQYNYFFFGTDVKVEYSKLTYIREGGYVIVPDNYDNVIKYNYVMYQNTAFSQKWYYAFVVKAEYATHNSTYLYLVPDEWQNYQNQIQFLESFVEREHINVSEDVAGANLLPESLEIGETKIVNQYSLADLEPYYIVAYMGENVSPGDNIPQNGFSYNGILSSVTFILASAHSLRNLLTIINNNKFSSQILTIFSVPHLAVAELGNVAHSYKIMDADFKQTPIVKTIGTKPTALDNYTPRNKKLLTYPFTYLAFNSPHSSQSIYRYENFANNNINFKFLSEINPNPSVAVIPQDYNGESGDSLQNMATINGYPTVSQRNDYFNTWIAQNSKQLEIALTRGEYNYQIGKAKDTINYTANSIDNIANLKVGSFLMGSANYVTDSLMKQENYELDIREKMAQVEAQKLIPDTASLSDSNATLLGYDLIDNNIFCRYSIKKQFAERIDKYFDMYGYSTNKIKVPNINTRPNWNYVKTIGVNIIQKANSWIPQEALQAIKDMFNNGITLWHNPNTFLDYSQNNRG